MKLFANPPKLDSDSVNKQLRYHKISISRIHNQNLREYIKRTNSQCKTLSVIKVLIMKKQHLYAAELTNGIDMMLKWKLKHAESETATISIPSTPIKSGNIGRRVVTKVGWLVGRTDFLNKNIV